jgi:hypothetical protein
MNVPFGVARSDETLESLDERMRRQLDLPRATAPTLPDASELEGRAERYEAETMRLESEVAQERATRLKAESDVARLQAIAFQCEETARLAQDQAETLRRELKFLRARDVELTTQARDALRVRDNLRDKCLRLAEDLRCALGGAT